MKQSLTFNHNFDDRQFWKWNDDTMLKIVASLAILTYGMQSVHVSETVFYPISLICLLGAYLKKSEPISVVCASLIFVHIFSDFTSLGLYWPAPVIISSVVGVICLSLLQRKIWIHKFNPEIKWLILAISLGLISVLTVWLWMVFTQVHPDAIIFKIDPQLPIWQVSIAIFSFAILNSFAEEFLFRGPIFEIDSFNLPILNFVQSVAFGFYHFKGFPFGVSGGILAFAFATLQGYLRIKSQKFYYVWISHFVANIGMGILLYQITIANKA